MNKKEAHNDKNALLKSAEYCAKKFVKMQLGNKRDYFLRCCIKKASTIIQDEPVPNVTERNSMQQILDVYDQMYYNMEIEESNDDSYGADNSENEFNIPQFDGANDTEMSPDEDVTD